MTKNSQQLSFLDEPSPSAKSSDSNGTVSATFRMKLKDSTDWSNAHVAERKFNKPKQAIDCCKHLSVFHGYDRVSVNISGELTEYMFSNGKPC